jgi:hypothetical protein
MNACLALFEALSRLESTPWYPELVFPLRVTLETGKVQYGSFGKHETVRDVKRWVFGSEKNNHFVLCAFPAIPLEDDGQFASDFARQKLLVALTADRIGASRVQVRTEADRELEMQSLAIKKQLEFQTKQEDKQQEKLEVRLKREGNIMEFRENRLTAERRAEGVIREETRSGKTVPVLRKKT